MTETKTILLIGRTGRGKSTLANVITGTDDFKEGKLGISETKEIKTKEFKSDSDNFDYLIIDNPGIGDTKLPAEKILDTIAEAVYLVKDGVSQVFFVTNGRFDQNEMATYNLLRIVIFNDEITKHTTIVRTRFEEFEDEEECETDISDMIDQGGELAEIIKSCKEKVIHVNNPPTVIAPIGTTAEKESEEDRIKRKKEEELNKKERDDSRKKLLNHLSENCQGNSYKPLKLQELSDEIVKFMEGKKKLEEELRNISKKKIKKLRNKKINDSRIKNTKDKDFTENISKEDEASAKQEKEQIDNSQDSGAKNKRDKNIEKEIKNLEDDRKKLKEEIEEKENIIRQKVFKHIFNNYDDLKKVLGSDIFINNVIGDDNNDWKKISEKFANKKLILEWRGQGFNCQQIQEWANALGNGFNPEYDAGFCTWLRDNKQLTAEKILNVNIEQLKSEYYHQLQSDNRELEIKLNLKSKQNWQLLNIIQRLKEDFSKWTSGNSEIDEFIQKYQLEATNHVQVIEWIPFDRLSDIKEIGKGGFGSVYSAIWSDGPIRGWNTRKNSWERDGSREVALKSTNAQNNIDFLQEIACHKLLSGSDSQIINCWGISQDPQTRNYLMVIDYIKEGSLYKFLRTNFRSLTWEDKIYLLYTINYGLNSIHEQNLIHQDFHSGNILCDGEDCYITDFGLSKKKDEIASEDEIYGVMPYVAPEILLGKKFTQAADIYGLGVVMAEMTTGQRPFYDREFNTNLARRIVEGERPEFAPGTPDCYIEFAKQCVDSDPLKRPTARDVVLKFSEWYESMESDGDNEIKKQFLDADEVIKTLPIISPSHPDHMYTSKIISTKLISSAIKEDLSSQADTAQINLDIRNNFNKYQVQQKVPPKENNYNWIIGISGIIFLVLMGVLVNLYKKKRSK